MTRPMTRLMTRKQISRAHRTRVQRRALYLCERCLRPTLSGHVDHVKPFSRGGRNRLGNYQYLCVRCNTSKGNRNRMDYRLRNHVVLAVLVVVVLVSL